MILKYTRLLSTSIIQLVPNLSKEFQIDLSTYTMCTL
jgi:hypothetical protein